MKNNTSHVTFRFRWLVVIVIFCACAVGAMAQPVSKTTGISAPTSVRVDVNSASLQTLETLPGVGPVIAKRIQEGRPYNSLQDLEKVKGLGKARIEALSDKITFGSTSSTSTKLAPGQQLNINTASVHDLEKLPEIGPVRAQAIVDYRAQNGSFKSIEDIQKVKGIKAGVFSKIKDSIKVTD